MTETMVELLHKRSELADRQTAIKLEISEIDQDLAALDRVLTLLDPSYVGRQQKRSPRSSRGLGFSRGELSDGVLEVFRDHDGLTAAECAEQLDTHKGIRLEAEPRLKPNVATFAPVSCNETHYNWRTGIGDCDNASMGNESHWVR
jgi:hypothetical protein